MLTAEDMLSQDIAASPVSNTPMTAEDMLAQDMSASSPQLSEQSSSVGKAGDADYKQAHDQMLNSALSAMTSVDPSATSAKMLGYAANVEKAVPFLHEAGSGIAAALGAGQGNNFNQRYENLEQSQQALREAADQTSPKIETPWYLPDITPSGIGQLGAGIALAPAMPAIGGDAAPVVANGFKTAVRTALKGAANGAAYGGAYGAGNGGDAFENASDSAGDRLGSAIKGAFISAPLGAVGGIIGDQLAKRATATPQLSDDLNIISGNLTNTDGNQAASMMQQLIRNKEQPLTIADVAPPSVQNLAEGLANQPNTNIDKVTDFLNQRNTSAPSRINDIIEQHIAPTDYIEQRQTTLNNLKSPEIKGAYQAAYDSVPSINDPEVNQTLDRLISTDVGRKAWQQAFQAATLDGRTLGPVDATGSLRSVSTYGIDQFKQQLDSTIRSEATNGNFDKMSPLGSKITNLKNQLVNRVDEINPIYGQARAQYGDEASLINAGDTGYKDIWSNKPGTAARIYDQFHNNMTPPEQQALLSGVARKIQEMGKVQAGDNPLPNTANPAKNIVNNPQVRERLTALLGDKPVGKFIDDMSTQAGMQDIANKILSNSATARRQAVQQDFAEKTASPLEKLRPLARYGSEFEALNPFTWIGINRKSVEQMGANASAANRSQIGSDVLGRLLNPDYSSNMKTLGALMNDPAKRASALAAYARLAGQGNNLITNALPRASNLLVSPQTQPQ